MGCAGVITDALAGSGVQNLSKIPPNKGRGYVIVSGEVSDGELQKLADAVNKALTPHRAQVQPLVSLELVAKLDEQAADAGPRKSGRHVSGPSRRPSAAVAARIPATARAA